ncbi:NAD(P)/FAD-dependent oxidoreductase [Roseateles violae]|uniref:NAD(P)/FAD-dependent oxidoreductase n=1 Tax=Roseateles violae TaxID=3058042 RepID=A0ABT8DNN0_9BURK|nr:NAD(P)/FAD-dependent oxidoreductase [Pelomonas sp. PFR6]MDN3919974.1 NAD(P)/FAD-dependent oxidoreductase [Pelomonas sp. PFR6]
MPNTASFDCLIVGAGPAGLTAAIYLRRFHRRVLLVDAGGSRLLKVSRSHNCPGYPDGIAGAELIRRLQRQLGRFGGAVIHGEIGSAQRREDGLFELRFAAETLPLRTRTLLLCTGVEDRLPALPGTAQLCEADLLRQCPICDGHEHSGRHIGVLGDTAHAEHEADFLRDYAASVRVIALSGPPDTPVAEALELDAGGARVRMSDATQPRFDVLYAALGVRPRNSLAAQLGARLDERGAVVVDAHCRSSVDGLYAAGDLVSALDQIAVAFGHGAIAATALHNALRERDAQ